MITKEELQSIQSWILSLMFMILFSCDEAKISAQFMSMFFLKLENTNHVRTVDSILLGIIQL